MTEASAPTRPTSIVDQLLADFRHGRIELALSKLDEGCRRFREPMVGKALVEGLIRRLIDSGNVGTARVLIDRYEVASPYLLARQIIKELRDQERLREAEEVAGAFASRWEQLPALPAQAESVPEPSSDAQALELSGVPQEQWRGTDEATRHLEPSSPPAAIYR